MKQVSGLLCGIAFLFNFLLHSAVCLLLGYSLWLFIQVMHVLGTNVVAISFTVIITFCVNISLASLLGCWGAWKKNCRLLFASASFNTFMFLMILNFILGFCFSPETIENAIKKDMHNTLRNYHKNDTNGYSTPGWDKFQTELECCGVVGYKDWFNSTEGAVPYSCARRNVSNQMPMNVLLDLRQSALPKYIYTNGCFNAIKRKIEDSKTQSAIAGVSFESLITLSIILTFYLAKKVRDTKDRNLASIMRSSLKHGNPKYNRLQSTASTKSHSRRSDSFYPDLSNMNDEGLINQTRL